MLPVTLEYAPKIKGSGFIPIAVVTQFTINVKKRKIYKETYHL